MPTGWAEDIRPSCDFVRRHGCFCGGDGIAWSRAAVLALMEGELDTTKLVSTATVDTTMGCIAHDNNITRHQRAWRSLEIYHTRTSNLKREHSAVYHFRTQGNGRVVAAQIRAVHAEYRKSHNRRRVGRASQTHAHATNRAARFMIRGGREREKSRMRRSPRRELFGHVFG